MNIFPESCLKSPHMARARVVFPAPFSPAMAIISPPFALNETPFKSELFSNLTVRLSTSKRRLSQFISMTDVLTSERFLQRSPIVSICSLGRLRNLSISISAIILPFSIRITRSTISIKYHILCSAMTIVLPWSLIFPMRDLSSFIEL